MKTHVIIMYSLSINVYLIFVQAWYLEIYIQKLLYSSSLYSFAVLIFLI